MARETEIGAVSARRWTKAKRTAFLKHLAATANVAAAARLAGESGSSAYLLRRYDADFAAAWADALQAGYDRLEQELLALALGEHGGDERADAPRVDKALGMQLLARLGGARGKQLGVTGADANAAIERSLKRKLAALEKRIKAARAA